MVNEYEIDAASRTQLVGVTTEEMLNFLREKFAPEIKCAMCGSANMHVIGSETQLYVFGTRTFLTDLEPDPRKFLFSIVECGNCGYSHKFSLAPLLRARAARSEGKV
ncbi:hypothetical protein ACL00O_19035 [Aeromonas sanarellii]